MEAIAGRRRSGRHGSSPKATVTASINCVRDASVLFIDVTVAQIGGKQTTRHYQASHRASLSGGVSQACVTGSYRGIAHVGVDAPGEAFDKYVFSQDVFIDCG